MLAERLAEQGCNLAISGRNEEKLNELSEKTGASAFPLGEIDWGSIGELAKHAAERLEGIDAVVNCIGSMQLKPIHLAKESEFDGMVNTHLRSSAAILAAVTPIMKRQSDGDRSIVLISSIAAYRGLPNHELIAMAKAGIDGLVRSAAATYARSGIRVNAVAPSLTHTPMTDRICSNESAREASEKSHPLGRIGQPGDISDGIAWLVSGQSTWVTGQILRIDGGMSSIQNLNAS